MYFNPVGIQDIALVSILRTMFNKNIGSDNLANGSVTTDIIQDGSITVSKLARSMLTAPQRQMIWQGYKDYSSDNSQFLTPVSNQLQITLKATLVPFVFTIANGFDVTNGQQDYVVGISSDVVGAWTLPANQSFMQLYIEYDPAAKALSYGSTFLECSYLKPLSPVTDQHWFDKGNQKIMQRWNGSSWENKIRIFVGEAVTGAASITSVTPYAIQSQYDSGWISVSANSNKFLNHNCGIKHSDGLNFQFSYSLDPVGADASFAHDRYVDPSGNSYGHYMAENTVQNTRNIIKFGFGAYTQFYRGAAQTSGYYRVTANRNW